MTARDEAALRLRQVTVADAGLLAVGVIAGMETYRSFAPDGWDPPPVRREQDGIRERLRAGAWGRLALEGDAFAGHVLFVAAAGVPGCAHLANLFVAERWWGSGLARRLLMLAVDEMIAQGYEHGRLVTPAAQARARRFYEREGWRPAPGEVDARGFGLELVEYRLPLSRRPSRR